jgi:hypothetical protein
MNFGFCYLYGKTHTSTNNNWTEVSLSHLTIMSPLQEDTFLLDFHSEGWGWTSKVASGKSPAVGTRLSSSALSCHTPALEPRLGFRSLSLFLGFHNYLSIYVQEVI